MAKRQIVIPDDVRCPDCYSNDLIGRGYDWRVNPNADLPPRIKIRMLRCKNCGKIFSDGEVKNDSTSKQ